MNTRSFMHPSCFLRVPSTSLTDNVLQSLLFVFTIQITFVVLESFLFCSLLSIYLVYYTVNVRDIYYNIIILSQNLYECVVNFNVSV